MERPDITKEYVSSSKLSRMVGRTQSIEEANRIAEQYEAQGYHTHIMKKSQAGIAIYEVWVSTEPDIFVGKK